MDDVRSAAQRQAGDDHVVEIKVEAVVFGTCAIVDHAQAADVGIDLDIGVIIVEEGAVQPQAVVEQRALGADLVGVQLLGEVIGRGRDRGVVAAALEAAVPGNVAQDRRRELMLQRKAPSRRILSKGLVWNHRGDLAPRRGGGDCGRLLRSLLIGITDAAGEARVEAKLQRTLRVAGDRLVVEEVAKD